MTMLCGTKEDVIAIPTYISAQVIWKHCDHFALKSKPTSEFYLASGGDHDPNIIDHIQGRSSDMA